MLQYWEKFSIILVRPNIGMILAKNCETVSEFVKVMPKTSASFSDTVYYKVSINQSFI